MLRRKKNAVPDADLGYKEPGDRRRKFILLLGVVMAVVATFTVLGISNGPGDPVLGGADARRGGRGRRSSRAVRSRRHEPHGHVGS